MVVVAGVRVRGGEGHEGGGREVTITRRSLCRLDAVLSPVEVVTRTLGAERLEREAVEAVETTLRFERGRAMLRDGDGPSGDASQGGEREVARLGSPPVTVSGLLRLAGLLPRETGAAWTFAHLVDLASPTVHTAERGDPYRVVCVGRESIRAAGREVSCVRHEVRQGAAGKAVVTMWVDDAGVLCQAMFGRELRATLGQMEPVEEDPYLRARLRGE